MRALLSIFLLFQILEDTGRDDGVLGSSVVIEKCRPETYLDPVELL